MSEDGALRDGPEILGDVTISDVDMDSFGADDWPVAEAGADEPLSARKDRFRQRVNSGRTAPKEIESGSAKTGMPSIDEWMKFISRVLIRTATDFVIDMAFRGIDENLLSDREIAQLKMSDEECDRTATPLAELAYKNKFTRKHGREIIATAGSIDALLQLGLWYMRVTRIAMKYRRIMNGQDAPRVRMRTSRYPPESPDQPSGNAAPNMHERTGNERSGPDTAQSNGHDRNWRPPIAGERIFNPGGG